MSTAIDYSSLPAPDTFPTLGWDAISRVLSAVRHAASSDTSRYNLNAIYLEVESGQLVATATDGHRLAQARIAAPEGSVTLPKAGFLLSLPDADRLIAEAKRLAKLHRPHGAAARLDIDTLGKLVVEVYGPFTSEDNPEPVETIRCKPIDGEFLNYRAVIPAPAPPQATFNPRYMADACDAFHAGQKGKRTPQVSVTLGDAVTAATFRMVDHEGLEAFAIIMPSRL